MDNAQVTIGQYRLSKTLGIGAFGKVKRKFNTQRHAVATPAVASAFFHETELFALTVTTTLQ